MKINFKNYVCGIITGLIIMVSISVYATTTINVKTNPYPVLIDEKETKIDGYNINGSTYLKLSDLTKIGVNVKFENNQIKITSRDNTIPEQNQTSIYNPTKLYDEDKNFEISTFKNMSSIKYKGNTFIYELDLYKKYKITSKPNGDKNNTIKLFKDNQIILETLDASPAYYISYKGYFYFNIKFLGKYLEN